MFDEPTIRFLHSGCGLVVGTVSDSGEPRASRGWGLTVVDAGAGRVRVLLDASDATSITNARAGAAVAITGADVRTLRSLQFKGRVVGIEPATDADAAKQAQYTRDFLGDIHETDGNPLDRLERWADRDVVACVVDVDASFDQTPGPTAGAPKDARRR